MAPGWRVTSRPSLNSTKVGMLRIPNLRRAPARPQCSPWPKRTRGSSCFAASANCGAIILHGPHQGAQKIHDDWNIAAANLPLKSSARELNRLPGKGALVALTALGFVIQARRRDAVDRVAMRADDMQYFTHVRNSFADPAAND